MAAPSNFPQSNPNGRQSILDDLPEATSHQTRLDITMATSVNPPESNRTVSVRPHNRLAQAAARLRGQRITMAASVDLLQGDSNTSQEFTIDPVTAAPHEHNSAFTMATTVDFPESTANGPGQRLEVLAEMASREPEYNITMAASINFPHQGSHSVPQHFLNNWAVSALSSPRGDHDVIGGANALMSIVVEAKTDLLADDTQPQGSNPKEATIDAENIPAGPSKRARTPRSNESTNSRSTATSKSQGSKRKAAPAAPAGPSKRARFALETPANVAESNEGTSSRPTAGSKPQGSKGKVATGDTDAAPAASNKRVRFALSTLANGAESNERTTSHPASGSKPQGSKRKASVNTENAPAEPAKRRRVPLSTLSNPPESQERPTSQPPAGSNPQTLPKSDADKDKATADDLPYTIVHTPSKYPKDHVVAAEARLATLDPASREAWRIHNSLSALDDEHRKEWKDRSPKGMIKEKVLPGYRYTYGHDKDPRYSDGYEKEKDNYEAVIPPWEEQRELDTLHEELREMEEDEATGVLDGEESGDEREEEEREGEEEEQGWRKGQYGLLPKDQVKAYFGVEEGGDGYGQSDKYDCGVFIDEEYAAEEHEGIGPAYRARVKAEMEAKEKRQKAQDEAKEKAKSMGQEGDEMAARMLLDVDGDGKKEVGANGERRSRRTARPTRAKQDMDESEKAGRKK